MSMHFILRSKFLSDKWMFQKGFLREEHIMVSKPWCVYVCVCTENVFIL